MKLFYIFVFTPLFLFAQEIPNTIRVNAVSNIFVPADQVKISINISIDDSVPRYTYQKHKDLESKLLELIKKYNIPDSLIVYSLPSFGRAHTQPGQPLRFQTSQEVLIRLKSAADYNNFQIELLENGFYNFRASFMTERIDEQKKKGYDAAMMLAENDAKLIAGAMNKKLGEIVTISASATDFPYVDAERMSQTALVGGNQKDLTEIKQSIQIRTYLNVVFEIED